MRLISLRTRLLLTHAPVVMIAIGCLAVFDLRDERIWAEQRTLEQLLRAARIVQSRVMTDSSAVRGNWPAFAEEMEDLLDCRVTLVAPDGRVLADSRLPEAAGRAESWRSDRPEILEALQGRVGSAVRRSATFGTLHSYVAFPVRAAGIGVVRLAQPLAMIELFRQQSLRLLGSGAVLTLILSLVLAYFVVGPVARRIDQLEQVTRRIGGGDFVVRASESPEDEIGHLGRAINRMAEERRARTETIQRERDERERILAHMSDGVALVDTAGRVLHCNHSLATLLGAPQPAAPGTSFREFARIPELDDLIRDARSGDVAIEDDLRLWAPRARLVHATATALGRGSDAAVLLVLRDLSEIEQLDQVRQDFVANVSHEMRTPLTSMRGYAETLLEGGLDDPENREGFVRTIRDQALRLERLLQDLMSIADLERPGSNLHPERFDFREFVQHQVSVFENRARRAGLTLDMMSSGPAEPVQADRMRIEQVMANLLDNAIKYTERGGIRVSVGGDERVVWCEVADTGSGVPLEDLPRVFERFYRVDKARTRQKGGTGLGLSIVKAIVELHGGETTVRSEPGAGSVFRFEIPRTQAAPPTA